MQRITIKKGELLEFVRGDTISHRLYRALKDFDFEECLEYGFPDQAEIDIWIAKENRHKALEIARAKSLLNDCTIKLSEKERAIQETHIQIWQEYEPDPLEHGHGPTEYDPHRLVNNLIQVGLIERHQPVAQEIYLGSVGEPPILLKNREPHIRQDSPLADEICQ